MNWAEKSRKKKSDKIQEIIDDMVMVMRKAPGVGLAAPQIDTKKYISYAPKEETKAQDRRPFDLLVIVNPKLPKKSNKIWGQELCFDELDSSFEQRSAIRKFQILHFHSSEGIHARATTLSACTSARATKSPLEREMQASRSYYVLQHARATKVALERGHKKDKTSRSKNTQEGIIRRLGMPSLIERSSREEGSRQRLSRKATVRTASPQNGAGTKAERRDRVALKEAKSLSGAKADAEAGEYSEQDLRTMSEVTEKIEQIDVTSWDSYTSYSLSLSWALQWLEANKVVGLTTYKAE
ncbi:hypothetical protein HYC85_028537 [Camellia sinensis]|uniref:Peptide deformylase n=1 Tax=Camellia sinensis TaxID=4442 RepID=A0A7J7FZF6_CAMSI|nr:hypothetical protein HYC85_028537 [Camellia sinensis]